MDRAEAIEKLKNGEIKVIFSVDMFNEGVDIPSVDMIMFLRPTESPVVFLQQLGRGLRRNKGKNISMFWTLSAIMKKREESDIC